MSITSNRADKRIPSTRRRIRIPRFIESARDAVRRVDGRQGLAFHWLLACFAIAVALIVLRDPTRFTQPQFWAEDGKVFFAQAYNGGWLHSLTLPVSGYLCTLPRLGAGAAMLVPLRWAPLMMALVGLLFQALPVPILLSARCRNWAPLSFRLLFAFVYVAIPDARDVHIVCTNTLWHLALVQVLLAFSAAPRSWFSRICEVAVFALASVSGPFALLVIPLLLIFWWVRRQHWSLVILSVVVAGSVIQGAVLRHYAAQRSPRFLGATLARFTRIVGGDIFLGTVRGSFPYGYYESLLVCAISLLIGLALIVYCWRGARAEVRLFFLFCFAVLAASLRSPIVPPTQLPLWQAILGTPSLRYWYFPSLVFLWALLWCACYARSRGFRVIGALFTVLLIQGVIRDWHIPPLKDFHFPEYAAQFEAAPPGTTMRIPLNPDIAWYMELTRK
jgi:hypothetical protein